MTAHVSVVVPTYKRPHLLDRCLGALIAQDFPAAPFDIIVADDAGGDIATWRVVRRRRREAVRGPRILYVRVKGPHGPAAARNRGWRAAVGEAVAFTDDDCLPASDWLREGMLALGDRHAAVWGRIVVPLPKHPTDYERDAAGLASAGFVTANCFCRRQVLQAVGGLDENFTAPWREDTDLYFSLLEQGYAVAQAPRAAVIHPVRPASWGASLRQQRKILFDALLYKKHRALYRARIRPRPRWDYYGTSALLLGAGAGWALGSPSLRWTTSMGWLAVTARFCYVRLRDTSRRPGHIAEMALTSALIPPLAVFWRLVGAVKFRVRFF